MALLAFWWKSYFWDKSCLLGNLPSPTDAALEVTVCFWSGRILPYLKGWDNPLNFPASAVQGSDFMVSEYLWIILSTLLICMRAPHCFSWNVIMNYQNKKKQRSQTKLLVWIYENETLENCCRFLQHFWNILLYTWLKCRKVCPSALQGLKLS